MPVLAACSGLTDNADGVASLEIRYPANTFLEFGASLQLTAVARNAAGDSVGVPLLWLTPDTTVVLEETGLVTPATDSGSARIQVGVFGQDTVLTSLSGLLLTLTRRADSLTLTTADSVTIARDTVDNARIDVTMFGGDPAAGVRSRPVIFRIVDPAPADTPAVIFSNGRAADSAMTSATGTVSATVSGNRRRPIPDRAVVEIVARRADGTLIPGSERLVVVRFLHQ
ncbi:MAG: hypothetical protein R2882_14145 [Gemmatimonadales bacterium]